MATEEEINALKEEYNALNGALISINVEFLKAVENAKGLDEASQRVAKTYQRDLTKSLDSLVRNNRELLELEKKQLDNQGLTAKEQKKLALLQKRVAKDRAVAEEAVNGLRLEGVDISAELELRLQEQLDINEEIVDNVDQTNTNYIAQRGLLGAIVDNATEYLLKLDKSGLAAKLLSGELNKQQTLLVAGEAAFFAIAKATLAGSDNIANLEKNLGISYQSAYQLQNSFAATTANSEKLFITSKDLNKSFTELANTTGLLSDFGGDTLVTMTTLTKQLGLGVGEASQLALLARTQGEDTESVLENTVDTVNAVNRQRKSAISAKAVLNDIATASKSIVVSLGMSPELLAEAATEARALGLNLEAVDKIASSLLDFESSIAAELEAELLLGKELNLEKARSAALDNDLATLSKEIANNAALTETFASGNRIQQEAAAAALNMSRDELAGMVMQQELMNLSQDEFIDKYGEQSYQQMQAMSASKKFEESLNKIKGVIGDIGTVFAPILDGFAKLVGIIAENKAAAIGLVGVMTTLAAISIVKSIADTISSFAKAKIPFAAVAGIAAAAGIVGMATAAFGSIQNVKDGIAPSEKGPFTITDAYGATAVTAKGDGLAVSPNINRGGGSNQEQQRTNMLLEKLLAKDTNINMDGRKLNNSMQTSGVSYDIGV